MITPTNKSELSASKQKFAVRCYLEQRYFFHLWSEDRVSMHSRRVWLAVFLASTLFFTLRRRRNKLENGHERWSDEVPTGGSVTQRSATVAHTHTHTGKAPLPTSWRRWTAPKLNGGTTRRTDTRRFEGYHRRLGKEKGKLHIVALTVSQKPPKRLNEVLATRNYNASSDYFAQFLWISEKRNVKFIALVCRKYIRLYSECMFWSNVQRAMDQIRKPKSGRNFVFHCIFLCSPFFWPKFRASPQL